MNVATLEKRAGIRINWLCVQRNVHIGAAIIFAFAAGGWWNSIHIHEQQLPYLERSTHELEAVKNVTGAKPLAVIGCLHVKADRAEQIAVQSVSKNGSQQTQKALQNLPECPHPKTGEITKAPSAAR